MSRFSEAVKVYAKRLSTWTTVLMSLAALATSWASYQASLWSGEQATYGGTSATYRTKATRAMMHADQVRMLDAGLFVNWLQATSRGDSALAAFVAKHFRRDFAVAFNEWMATKPLSSPDAASTPFALPSYRSADDARAENLEYMADRDAAAGQRANQLSDRYVFDAVIMATVMFFAGAAQNSGPTYIRVFMLLVALAMFTSGIVRLFDTPTA